MPENWEDANKLNKDVLFSALAAAGITEVFATFDGYGDSGQIEKITIQAGHSSVDLPNVIVAIHERSYSPRDLQIASVERLLREAGDVLLRLLGRLSSRMGDRRRQHGEFHFDVAAHTVRLEYNCRLVETEVDDF